MLYTKIKKQAPEAVLSSLRQDSPGASREAGLKLIGQAREAGLSMRNYLTLAIDPKLSENKDRFHDGNRFLNGYEAALAYLELPVRDDLESGVLLQAASDTFQTFPGTRAMFPEVVDDMVRWKYRQDVFERVDPIVGNSRVITQPEMISTVVEDEKEDYEQETTIAELGRIPVHTIRTSQTSVGIWKHGMGYRTSYEFSRRASIDLLTPYAARANRELERSKVKTASLLLVNGDSVHGAAPVVAQSSFNDKTGQTATNGKINYLNLLAWLVQRANAGMPVDTVLGNWDAYLQWLMLFAVPRTGDRTDVEDLARAGFQLGGVPLLSGVVNFALSSAVPANQLVGYSRGDTLEELVEAGSLINESERAASNQSITYYRTENTGYRLVFGDTRSIYNFGG